MAELDPHWLERWKAVGGAQARYLWILLVLVVFYAALAASSPSSTSLKVPIVEVNISGLVVLASGTAVLSFVVLVIAGSMRALRRAREQGLGGRSGEEFDAHPNAIDLAFYAPPQSNKIFSHLARFVYALFLLLALLEGLWLSRYMVEARLPAWYVLAVFSALLWIRALWLVGDFWRRCIHDLLTLRKAN